MGYRGLIVDEKCGGRLEGARCDIYDLISPPRVRWEVERGKGYHLARRWVYKHLLSTCKRDINHKEENVTIQVISAALSLAKRGGGASSSCA